MSDKPVLLRAKGTQTSRPFTPDHAERVLAYPNTQWEKVTDEKPSPKPEAAAGTK